MKKILNKNKKLLNMLALVIMIRSRYTSPLLFISTHNKNSLEYSLYSLFLIEAINETMANVKNSKK